MRLMLLLWFVHGVERIMKVMVRLMVTEVSSTPNSGCRG
jgi:hypothetical protein